MVQLPRNKKQTHRLNSRLQMWPLGLTLAMTLTLNFQGQTLNWLYLSQKWSNCHETKNKHIDWTLGFKCYHWVWPWPWPWPWIFKVKYRIGYISAMNGAIATKRKASNVTIGFDLGHDLDLEFSRSNIELAISQPKMVQLPRNKKQTHWLNSRLQMWPLGLTLAMTLTLNFQGQTLSWLYLSQKWSNCHETKNKHIDWTLGFKCYHWVWPWPWPWPWIFKVKYRIGYISAKNGAIATKRNAYISIDLKTSNVTIRFYLCHDLDLEFSRSNMKFATSQPKVVRFPRNEKQTYQF